MRSLSIARSKEKIGEALEALKAFAPSVVFLFVAPSVFRDPPALALMREKLTGLHVIGCSTAGEIAGQGYTKAGISALALRFDKTQIKLSNRQLLSSADSFSVGKDLAVDLKDPNLKAVFVFCPGTQINGSAIVRGMNQTLGPSVVISGGLAGDEADFKQTFTLCNNEVWTDRVVALGLYGDHVAVSCGSEGGWRPFGPARRVTMAKDNVLYELDGRPALQLYKQYLGDKARYLPASGLAYPFAILRSDRTTSGLIRSALNIDHETESLILAGEIPQGSKVCLLHADTAALVQGAAQAAAEALRTHPGPEENGAALVVSCVGRRLILGIDVDEEIEAVSDSFLPQTSMAGFYSYGEIASYVSTGQAEFHNQTMTIAYITERNGGQG